MTTESASSRWVRVRNIAASAAVVGLACAIYAVAPHNQERVHGLNRFAGQVFTGGDFLYAAACAYVLALVVYYAVEPQPHASKSLRFFAAVAAFARAPFKLFRRGLAHVDRVAVLTTLLKAYFGPFMVMALLQHVLSALGNGWAIAAQWSTNFGLLEMFNRYGYQLMLKFILFVDVAVFTVGYLVEMPRLKNEIRSVDPTLLGWAAAMLCYPPFNKITGAILGSNVSDFPQFDDPAAHVILNLLLLVLMGIYASASIALGLKASNLTHRGIVARGPYARVRHPAYVAKNMAWWIGSIPLVSAAFAQSTFAGAVAVASVIGWSLLYVLRAVTEEDHLRSVDGEYAAYAARVRYRFIPGVV
jgi:hypothetical protein